MEWCIHDMVQPVNPSDLELKGGAARRPLPFGSEAGNKR